MKIRKTMHVTGIPRIILKENLRIRTAKQIQKAMSPEWRKSQESRKDFKIKVMGLTNKSDYL